MTPKTIHWRELKYHWPVYLFVLPTVILIGLFQYYPASSGIFHSFYRWNGADISEYVGWDNYTDLLGTTAFWQSFKVAFILGAWNIVKMIPALAVAVCIHRCRSAKMQFFYRILFVIPMVIPGLVIALIWRSFFFEATNGYLNGFLKGSGLMSVLSYLSPEVFKPGRNPAWLGDPQLILTSCIVWGFPWVGSFAVLTHLAKLQNIPRDIYEAAEIDGAGWFRKFTKIELPLMSGSIYLLLVFVIIDTIKDAGMIIALAGLQGGPGGVVTVPALFMIRKAFLDQQMGYACAVGIVLTVIVMTLQKLSTGVTEWSSLTKGLQALIRLMVLAMGALVIWGGMWPVGVLLILAVIPWGWVMKKMESDGSRPAALDPEARERISVRFTESARLAFERAADPAHRFRRKLSDGLLRLCKHGFVWMVLFFAFLPLYLMVIVSLKDNNQFYQSPARLTEPYHWENWSYAWQQITPTVANSIFYSTAATALALIFATGAAYFFARMKMPFTGFLWNAILVLMMMPAIANLVPLFCLLRDLNLLNTLTALILVGASGGQVFAIFVLRNFVADIPQDLFEAAEIDGAGHFQQLKMVVVPLSGPIMGTVGVMLFIGLWNDFVLPLIIIRDQAGLPVMVQLLRMAGEYIKYWGPLMSGYAIASIPVIILFIFSMKLFVRGLTEGAIKG